MNLKDYIKLQNELYLLRCKEIMMVDNFIDKRKIRPDFDIDEN